MVQPRQNPSSAPRRRRIHPAWLRITHWLNAIAVLIMIASGWRIYDASPLFAAIYFPPSITLGGWLAGALLWHFAAMWLLIASFLIYLTINVVSGRFASKLLPISARVLSSDLRAALHGALRHEDLSRYNMVQRAAYLGAIVDTIVLILSGVAIWKPVQFSTLCGLLGGYDAARLVHFFAMVAMVAFLLVHVVMSLLVPRSLRAIFRGDWQ
jgi:thiosulfate reductase cytochrome b subunit